MIRLASTEISRTGEVLSVFRPEPHYLQGVLPREGVNILAWGDDETSVLIKQFIDHIFDSGTPVELELNINPFSIQLTAHAPKGDTAFVYWKDINATNKVRNAVKEDWGFDELPLQKRLDIEIPKTENYLRRFTDNLPLVVFEIFLYPDGRFEFGFVNKEMETFFPGFNREAVNADNSLLFIRVHPEDKVKLLDSIKNVFRLNVWDIEYRIIENGEIRWVKGFGRPEVGGNGDKITVCTYLRDITEKKLLDSKLELVDFSLRNASIPIFFVKSDASFFDFNEASVKLLGYSREELMGMKVYQLDPAPAYSEENWQCHWDELKEKKTLVVETQLVRKDGFSIDVVINVNIINHNGIELNCAYLTDVTEKKKLDEQIRLTDYMFRNTVTAITLIEEDGTFYDFNEAANNLFGYTHEEYKKLNVIATNPSLNEETWRGYWEELKIKGSITFYTSIYKKDGSLMDAEVRANMIKYGDKWLNFTIATDISEKKKIDEQLKLVDFSFRNSATPMHFIKEDCSFFDFNDAMPQLLGYSNEEYKKLTILDIDPRHTFFF